MISNWVEVKSAASDLDFRPVPRRRFSGALIRERRGKESRLSVSLPGDSTEAESRIALAPTCFESFRKMFLLLHPSLQQPSCDLFVFCACGHEWVFSDFSERKEIWKVEKAFGPATARSEITFFPFWWPKFVSFSTKI